MMTLLLVLSWAGDLTAAGVCLCADWVRAGLWRPLPSADPPLHPPEPGRHRDCEPPHHQDFLHWPLPPSHLPTVQPGRWDLSVQDLTGQHGETATAYLNWVRIGFYSTQCTGPTLHSRRDFYQCLTKCSISACFHGEDFFIRSWEDFYSKFPYFTC